jgi:hypothetical protein
VKRSQRWAAILLFGTAIFSAESAVRAALPANPACVRNGVVGLLKAPYLVQRQKPAMAVRDSSTEFLPEIAQEKRMPQATHHAIAPARKRSLAPNQPKLSKKP